ncbi:MAG: hypothetical protein IPK85_04775 [Gemmatimonadetes bacterium]|nr:hypothetical protein [Gemmatimonadota bacterium]
MAGCASDEAVGFRQPLCELDPRPAVVVTVQDWVTKEYIGSGATLVLQDGAFRDSVSVPPNRPDLNAQRLATPNSAGREGTYTVRVTRPPYAALILTSVQVGTDGCNVVPAVLSLHLRMPLSG